MRSQFVRTAAVGAFAALVLVACGSSSKTSSPPSTAPQATSPATTAPTTTAAPPTTAASSNPTGPATVAVAANATIGKSILVNGSGMTLYVWDNDATPGKASCTGACAAAWPPVDVTGAPTVGAGLTASMFSTVTGPNGEKQLAVNGKPLYLWVNDKAAGDATGQGVNGFHVVGSDGAKISS